MTRQRKKCDAFCGFYFIYSIAFSLLYTSHLYAKFTLAFKMQSLREKQTEIIDDSFCFTQIFAQTNELQTANHGSWHKALNKETSPFCFNMCSSLTWSRTHSYICTVLICSSFHLIIYMTNINIDSVGCPLNDNILQLEILHVSFTQFTRTVELITDYCPVKWDTVFLCSLWFNYPKCHFLWRIYW